MARRIWVMEACEYFNCTRRIGRDCRRSAVYVVTFTKIQLVTCYRRPMSDLWRPLQKQSLIVIYSETRETRKSWQQVLRLICAVSVSCFNQRYSCWEFRYNLYTGCGINSGYFSILGLGTSSALKKSGQVWNGRTQRVPYHRTQKITFLVLRPLFIICYYSGNINR